MGLAREVSRENNDRSSTQSGLLIGFDLSTSMCTLVLGYGKNAIDGREFMAARHRTKLLVPTVSELFQKIQAKDEKLIAVAVGIGPGNFTGVRVAVATARALAFGWGLPVLGINSLDILAQSACGSGKTVLACQDAKRNQIYCALYRNVASGLSRISDYECMEPILLPELLKKSGVKKDERLQAVGEGALLFKEVIRRELGEILVFPDGEMVYPGAEPLLCLATAAWEESKAVSPQALRPLYLKRPMARLPGRKDQ